MELNDKQLQKLDNGREYRSFQLETRETEDGKMVLEGYATTFDDPYELYSYGNFTVREQIDSHAFDDCDMTDVIMQVNHDGMVYARTRNNTLELKADSKGLFTHGEVSGTALGREVYEGVKGGYMDRMSMGFVVEKDKREYITDESTGHEECLRTILKIKKLYDVSVVSIPANDSTSISARRYADGVIDGIKAERLERAKKKLNLLIEMEE